MVSPAVTRLGSVVAGVIGSALDFWGMGQRAAWGDLGDIGRRGCHVVVSRRATATRIGEALGRFPAALYHSGFYRGIVRGVLRAESGNRLLRRLRGGCSAVGCRAGKGVRQTCWE